MQKNGHSNSVMELLNTRLCSLVFIIPFELRIEKTRLTRPVNLRCEMKNKEEVW